MRLSISLLLAISLLPAMSLTPGLVAPDAHAQDAAVYVVSYVEVAPAASATAPGLLRQLADAARKDDGTLRFEILERVAVPNQFAIVAIWRDQKAYDAYAASPHSKEFRDKIKPHLISAIDDRQHRGMETAAAQIKGGLGAVFVVTHVDVPPPQKDDCTSALKTLVGDSGKEAGAVRFEVFQQMSRPNHFSVVEIWKDRNAYDAHITAEHTRKFREQLTPMSGALYDERLYKAL
jgi:quinol monooxygenase YgiN